MDPAHSPMIAHLARVYAVSGVRARSMIRAGMFYFVFVAGVTTVKSATNALYLAREDASHLPYLYLSTAVAITLVTIYLGKRLVEMPSKPVLRAAILITAVILGVLSVLAAIDFRPALGVLYVVGEVYATALSVLFWARLGEVFDVRSAKRVFGAIAAAGMAGAVLGGLMVRGLVDVMPSVVWCFFGAATLMTIRPLLGKEVGARAIRRKKISFSEGLTYAARDRFPRGVALLVLLLAVQTAAVDYVFRTGAVLAESGDEASLAGLFGVLNAVVGVGAILFQVLVTGRLLRRLGVFVFLSVVPILCLAAGSWAIAVPTVFLPIFALKTIEMMGSLSLNQPGLQLLYNPMPTAMRDSVRALVDGAIKKMGGAVGGIVLLVFGAGIDRGLLLGIVIAFSVLILLWLNSLRGGYLRALEEKIGRRAGAMAVTIDASDKSTRAKLIATLDDPDPGKVIAALNVLARHPDIDLSPFYERLLAHASEHVRVRTIEIMDERPDPAHVPLLERVLASDGVRPTAQAARALEHVDPVAARRALIGVLEAPEGEHDLGLSCAAISALLSSDDAGERRIAEGALAELFSHGRRGPVEERRELARMIGHLGPGPYARRLATFLDDPDPTVRIAAVEAAALAQDPSLPPKLLYRLFDRPARRQVIDSLAAYGDSVVPLVRGALDDRRQPLELRVHLPRILRRIGTQNSANAMLYSNVNDDAYLRHVIIEQTSRLRRHDRSIAFDPKRIEEAAMRRLRAYAHYQPIALDLAAGGPPYRLLTRAVEDRVTQNLEDALRVLGLVTDPEAMDNAYRGFVEGSYADSVELVDVTLAGHELRQEVLECLEKALPSAVGNQARHRAYTLVEGRDIQIAMIAWETLKREGEEPPEVREPTQGEPLMPKAIIDRVFVLEGVQLFHGLSVDDLAAVAALTTEGHASPREVVYREGDPGDSMYIIASGEVHLYRGDEPLMDLYAGDSFGQVSILDSGPRPVTAEAGDEGVDYLVLQRDPFLDLIADRPGVVNGLFSTLARRLRELVELTGNTAGNKARRRHSTIAPVSG
ncbi:MAG: cyclic nucleotide-binding domain-containing protein [Deltaproteobacteria bacterium]|jgi:HEAT repeat protein